MKAETHDRIQPYVDEYCEANKKQKKAVSDYRKGVGSLELFNRTPYQLQQRMGKAERSIMQILIEEHESNPINELK